MWIGLFLFAFSVTRLQKVAGECSKQDYQYCVRLADPLLKDPQLIYPDKQVDIEHVCRTWSLFVDCVKKYTEKCFTDIRRQEFNKAVESPVDSIHQLCTVPQYQAEYLKHASCMKATLTKDSHCGRHYRHLAAQVSGDAGRPAICCSHHRFRECVLDRTRNTCDPEAGPFSRQILDKALSFLKDQCNNYEPSRVDCPGADFYSPLGRTDGTGSGTGTGTGSGPMMANTKPMFDKDMRTTGYQSDQPSWMTDSMSTKTMTGGSSSQNPDWLNHSPSWLPGRGRSTEMTVTSETIAEMSGPRTSYGRGMSWMPSPTTTPPPPPPPPPAPTTSWRVTGSYPSQTPWFPSRNTEQMMMDNAIDEPNQQGLESASGTVYLCEILLFLTALLIFSMR